MSTSTSIIDQLRASVAARKDSLTSLRSRIAKILEPLPVGVVLSDDAGEVCKIVRICTGASQWANRTWEVTIKGVGAIAAGKLLCEVDLAGSYWDGNNMHDRSTEPTCLYPSDGDYDRGLTRLSGADTRAIALRLPVAIARYMERCEQERVANDATLFI